MGSVDTGVVVRSPMVSGLVRVEPLFIRSAHSLYISLTLGFPYIAKTFLIPNPERTRTDSATRQATSADHFGAQSRQKVMQSNVFLGQSKETNRRRRSIIGVAVHRGQSGPHLGTKGRSSG